MQRFNLTKLFFVCAKRSTKDKRFRFGLLAKARQQHIPTDRVERVLAWLQDRSVESFGSDLVDIAGLFRPREWRMLMRVMASLSDAAA